MYLFKTTNVEAPEEAPQFPEQAPPSPDYVPGPEHLPVTPSNLSMQRNVEYPKALPYVANSNPSKVDLEEDPEEDPAEYPANGGDNDNDDDDDEEHDDKDDDEEEEHLALANSFTVPVVDPVPLAEDTKVFETNESAPTPPSPRPHRARISVRLKPPMAAPMEACIAEYAVALTPPLPLLSPITPLSSSLP
ncbi:hypothetical protein Tco_0776557 [Tanacetum coccineum]